MVDHPAIYDLIEAEYKRGYFRGVGEFHIYGNAAQAPLVKQVVDFAAARNLYLLAHCDEAALLILLAHNRSAKIIWAHTGFSTPTRRVSELLETNPELMGELSYRGGISEGGGLVGSHVHLPPSCLHIRLSIPARHAFNVTAVDWIGCVREWCPQERCSRPPGRVRGAGDDGTSVAARDHELELMDSRAEL